MNIQFFATCHTLEEVKKMYRKLSMENHPDRGGDTETMQAINRQYSEAVKRVLRNETNKKTGEAYTEDEINDEMELNEKYREALEKISGLNDVTIELVGCWIWVTGTKREEKDKQAILKNAGFFYASKKVAWYFRTEENKSFNRTKMSLDEIRNRYGSKAIKIKRPVGIED